MEIELSNTKETSKHMCVSKTTQPFQVESKPVPKLQKDKVLYMLQMVTIILICLIFLGMFAILL